MSAKNPSSDPHAPLFDRRRIRTRRERFARSFPEADFLHRRAMGDIVDRLESVTREFPRALFIGAGGMTDMLTRQCGVGEILEMDTSPARLSDNTLSIVGDEGALPIAPASLDLIVSLLTLHTVNDFIGALIQARKSLKPDGLFLAAVFAEGTLQHFRAALQTAEIADRGALAARIAPFAAIQDFGQALGRAGFALPVVDTDEVEVRYSQPLKLIEDLRRMGETGVLAGPSPLLRRTTLGPAIAQFDADGGAEIFNIAYLTGWAPHESQQKPSKRGSATMSLAEAVNKFK